MGVAERAAEIRRAFQQTKVAIEKDTGLTAAGKQQRIDDARTTANDEIRGLRAAQRADLAEARDKVIRRLSSPPTSFGRTPSEQVVAAASFRDALARADATKNGRELAELLSLAELTSDALQARAVFTVALRRDMGGLVDVYVQSHPEVAEDIRQLAELNRLTSTGGRVKASFLGLMGV